MSLRHRAVDVWQRALEVPYASTARSAQKLRDTHPGATPGELIEIANQRFKARVKRESGVAGAFSAWPGIGTALSIGASGLQFGTFLTEAAHHCMVVAHLYGIDVKDPAKRNALVLAAITGQEGAEAITTTVGIQAASWFASSFVDIRSQAATQFNQMMLKWAKRKLAKRAALSSVGRLVPFGIGAVVGWNAGAALANKTIEGLAIALGTPPADFSHTRIIDVSLNGDAQKSDAFAHLALPLDDKASVLD